MMVIQMPKKISLIDKFKSAKNEVEFYNAEVELYELYVKARLSNLRGEAENLAIAVINCLDEILEMGGALNLDILDYSICRSECIKIINNYQKSG